MDALVLEEELMKRALNHGRMMIAENKDLHYHIEKLSKMIIDLEKENMNLKALLYDLKCDTEGVDWLETPDGASPLPEKLPDPIEDKDRKRRVKKHKKAIVKGALLNECKSDD